MRRLALRSQSALLRFSRWSRSGAATFRSLGREVSIRTLSGAVLRSLERKTQTLLEGMLTDGFESLAMYAVRDEEELCQDEQVMLYFGFALETPRTPQGHIGSRVWYPKC